MADEATSPGERRIELGGLSALAVGDPDAAVVAIVLHGRQMQASDLAPFGHSLGGPAYMVFPDAPLPCEPRGRTWWPIDSEARLRALSSGPMELSAMDPPGRAEARALLASACAALARPGRRLVLIGFSQGGMLAMDHVLHADTRPDALALLSSTRIAIADWRPRAARLAGLPVLVAHGRDDAELAFRAGELLRDLAQAGGADVTWLPFDGGHELPLVVWRALRKLLRAVATAPA
jgi:phospholipase/carboxylesterase